MQVTTQRNSFFFITMLILLSAGALLYYYWPTLLFKAQEWQKLLHQQLTALLIAVQRNESRAGHMLIGLSFLYGVLHSAGPGHGKMIITTYLATQPTYYKGALVITLLSALLQGIVAIGLVLLAVTVLSLTRKELGLGELWLERLSFILIIGLGVLICLKVLYKQYKKLRSLNKKLSIVRINQPVKSSSYSVLLAPNPQTTHQHTAQCGCGHKHIPSADELKKAHGLLPRLTMILAIGIRPCSGAVLVMIFSKVLGIFYWGMLAVLAMSLGTALTISLIALLVLFFRSIALKFMHTGLISPLWLNSVGVIVTLIGGGLLILFGLLLLFATPAVNPILFGQIRT